MRTVSNCTSCNSFKCWISCWNFCLHSANVFNDSRCCSTKIKCDVRNVWTVSSCFSCVSIKAVSIPSVICWRCCCSCSTSWSSMWRWYNVMSLAACLANTKCSCFDFVCWLVACCSSFSNSILSESNIATWSVSKDSAVEVSSCNCCSLEFSILKSLTNCSCIRNASIRAEVFVFTNEDKEEMTFWCSVVSDSWLLFIGVVEAASNSCRGLRSFRAVLCDGESITAVQYL